MSDNSVFSSGSDQEEEHVNEKYLSINRKEQVKALAQEKSTAWGKKKQQFYKEQEESEDSDDEEVEAQELQLKANKKLNDVDYWDVNENDEEDEQELQENINKTTSSFNKKAVSALADSLGIDAQQIDKMNEEEISEKLLQGWPELIDIIQELEVKGKEYRQLNKIKVQGFWNKRYNQIRKQILANYLGLLMFYLQLRSHTHLSDQHPIFKKIIEMKELLEKCEDSEQYAQLLQMHQDKQNENQQQQQQQQQDEQDDEIQQEQQNNRNMKSLKDKLSNIYRKPNRNEIREQKKINKVSKLLEQIDQNTSKQQQINIEQESVSSINMNKIQNVLDDYNSELGEDDIYKENKEKLKQQKMQKKKIKKEKTQQNFQQLSKLQQQKQINNDDDPRKINYIMLKNISLLRRRRGNRIRNSRVKHKLKYQKALQKLKTQNKYIKSPVVNQYGGESGIKSGLVRGVKLH